MDRVTKPQKKMLITLLRETKFIEGKKEKEWYWEKIQAALNTIGPKKTIIQWKKCWRDMRLTTRKKLAELKRCQLAGGSPPPGIELNQEDNDIIDIVGTEYFYEEMNGELKPENFMSNFDYVPEHFCDAILTATAATSSQQHSMQQPKDPNSQQEQHGNDGETENVSSANQSDSHGGSFHGSNVSQIHPPHNGEHTASSSNHNSTLQHSTFPSGLHPHLIRRHHQAAFQRESGFEEKLLQLMQDVFPKKSKKRKRRDPDKLFLLSLYEEIKRVPEEIRLDVKAELIQVLKKYQKKSPVKQEKSHSNTTLSTASKQTGSTAAEKLPLPQQAQLSHSMYQLQKKYDKAEKETSPQSQVDRVQQLPRDNATLLQSTQQMPHGLFQMQQKKYEETSDKVHHQNEQRKHVDSSHQQQQQQHTSHSQPQPPPPSNEQHLHHPQMPHGIMFPLAQIRNEQPTGQQHHPHNPHQQQPQHNPHPQHHPSTIFGAPNSSSSMSTDRPSMPYESVG